MLKIFLPVDIKSDHIDYCKMFGLICWQKFGMNVCLERRIHLQLKHIVGITFRFIN